MVKQNEIDNTGTINTPNGTDLEDVIEETKHDKLFNENVSIEQSTKNNNEDKPFKELDTLINNKGIKTKTILNDSQIIHIHKLETLRQFLLQESEKLKNDDFKALEEAAHLIENFNNDFMSLLINKEGISRKQFIEAMHNGREKIEQNRHQKLGELMTLGL